MTSIVVRLVICPPQPRVYLSLHGKPTWVSGPTKSHEIMLRNRQAWNVNRHEPVAIFVASVFATACAAGGSPAGSVVRDSAGITIVENTAARWDVGDEWRVAELPAVRIGTVDGPEAQQLFRVTAALRLPGGRIVVVNNGSHELRFYDREGVHLFSAGREGGGPGEFRTLQTAWLLGDSLYAYDWQQFRVSVFATTGDFGRSFNLAHLSDGTLPYLQNLFADRALLVQRMGADGELRSGRDTVLFVRYSLEGEELAPLGAFADDERYIARDGNRVASIQRPFGLRGRVAVHQTHLYYGSNETYQIEVYTSTGVLERILRRAVASQPLTSDDVRAYEEERREALARSAPLFRELHEQVELPETKPAHGDLIVDERGNVWVAEYRRRREDQSTWDVFAATGEYLGIVQTPQGGRIFQIGEDFVLGLWRDDLEVEQVRLYAIEKPMVSN
jgi:hypothetical protein